MTNQISLQNCQTKITPSLESLPVDLKYKILVFLPDSDRWKLFSLNKRFYSLIHPNLNIPEEKESYNAFRRLICRKIVQIVLNKRELIQNLVNDCEDQILLPTFFDKFTSSEIKKITPEAFLYLFRSHFPNSKLYDLYKTLLVIKKMGFIFNFFLDFQNVLRNEVKTKVYLNSSFQIEVKKVLRSHSPNFLTENPRPDEVFYISSNGSSRSTTPTPELRADSPPNSCQTNELPTLKSSTQQKEESAL